MPTSFDSGDSTLLCGEDGASFLDDDEVSSFVTKAAGLDLPFIATTTYNAVSLPLMDEESIIEMIEKEEQHQPNNDYLKRLRIGECDLDARREAVDLIGKIHSHFGFGPACACLAINYLDRFLSGYALPKGQDWTIKLLSVAVLSLAAKVEETDVPLCMDLQMDSKILFEAKAVQRMELLILSTLKWRMHATTPFSFIDYFLSKINGDTPPSNHLIILSLQIVLGIIKGFDFLEFRPSEIAAAVTIAVVGRTKPLEVEQAVSVLAQHIDKRRVTNCMKLVQDSAFMGTRDSVFSLPRSPIGVLDATFFSYTTDDLTAGSCVNSPKQTIPPTKRRKLCEFL